MEQLISIVTDYVRGKTGAGTAWYVWSCNADRVPPGVLGGAVLKGDWYASNVHLKHSLNRLWLASPGRRQELEHYDGAGFATAFELNLAAPPGMFDHKVMAYVAPNSLYSGNGGGRGGHN